MIKKVIRLDLSLIEVFNVSNQFHVNRKEEALRLVEEPVSNTHTSTPLPFRRTIEYDVCC